MKPFFVILSLSLLSAKSFSRCTPSFSVVIKGTEVSFTNLSSTTEGSITANSWDFGDGFTSTETNPVHSYTYYGAYAVRLAIHANDGCSDTLLKIIRIIPPATLVQVSLCPPSSTASLDASIDEESYQWQVSIDSATYTNLFPGIYYEGTNSKRLKLNTIPSSFTGYRYRCLVNGQADLYIYQLRFLNEWTGASGSNWSNPVNWSCGSLPDMNTDVVISKGNIILDINTSIRSLMVIPPATITLQSGVILAVLH